MSKKIKGKDVAALLHNIHIHAELLLNAATRRTMNSADLMKDPEEIVYREKDLLPILEALGLPAPKWGKSMSIEEWLKSRK